MPDFKTWPLRNNTLWVKTLVIVTMTGLVAAETAKRQTLSLPPPHNNKHREGQDRESPLRQMEEDYYGEWDPAPYFGGSYPAPIPHWKKKKKVHCCAQTTAKSDEDSTAH
ncbi:unnamed protein product [Cuscuta campestris]|uniref:Uncharacterized protein n=1 Tax=Cuscuta campestris TaxID=132261 RepID=A0A484KD33_9ASTE|nr:unnamed protein product [Cuscuta campestris]